MIITTKRDPKFVASPLEVIAAQLRDGDYSPQTIKAYLGQLKAFFKFLSPKLSNEATNKNLYEYLDNLNKLKKSRSTIDQTVNALRFFWKKSFGRGFPQEIISRPVKKNRKPVFLTLEEVQQIAMAAENLKHRLMIELAYSAGLRVSELVNIQVRDLNLESKNLYVRGIGKNKKGRTTIFCENLQDDILKQIGTKKPDDFLFSGYSGGRLTTRAFAKYFKSALSYSGVGKAATPHSLRHSFAAKLLAVGYKISTVQNLLGHVRKESTIFYAKLDGLKILSNATTQMI